MTGLLKVAAVALAGAAALFAVGFGLFVRGLTRVESAPAERADAIVALTGGAERIGDAARLLADGLGRRLLITGVNPRTTADDIARREPRLKPLLDCCVDLDRRAMNTVGNATETADWARRHGVRSLIVVTSSWHMPRTLAELRAAAPDLRFVPFAVVSASFEPDAWSSDERTFRLLAYEYVKYVAVRTRIAVGMPAHARLLETPSP